MAFDNQIFIDTKLDDLLEKTQDYYNRGWRFVQICGTTIPDGVELIYAFSNDYKTAEGQWVCDLENLKINISNEDVVPSITNLFLAAFVFENETHDLFGVEFKDIALDFGGHFYQVSVPTPMNPNSKIACKGVSIDVIQDPVEAETVAADSAEVESVVTIEAVEAEAVATEPIETVEPVETVAAPEEPCSDCACPVSNEGEGENNV